MIVDECSGRKLRWSEQSKDSKGYADTRAYVPYVSIIFRESSLKHLQQLHGIICILYTVVQVLHDPNCLLIVCVFSLVLCRDDVAELAVEALLNPVASGLTFEVKSDIPFSTIWKAESVGDQPRNYG